MELEYKPPFDSRLEEYIIGAMIYDPECIADVVELIKPRFFYHTANQRVFERIVSDWGSDEKKVDMELLAPFLLENRIELTRLSEVFQSIVTTANIAYFCEQLKDLASLRAAGQIGKELVEASSLREKEEIKAAIGKAELKLARINDATVRTDSMMSMRDAVLRFHENFEKLYYGTEGGVSGIPTGITDLDALTAGLHRTDLIIIGARPAMGKTTFASQLALNVSLHGRDPGEPTAFFSLEQSTDQLVRRAMANQAMIDLSRLNSAMIEADEWAKYTMAMSMLTEANLVIDDQPGLTVNEIKAKCRKIKRERGLALILIDYLGKIRAPDPRMDRYEAVSENARMLKDMAKEFEVPVVCLAQLSRGVEHRQDKRPTMADLRDSGEIEQEADIIGFLYRDDYYNRETEKKGITELILAKHRNGPIGTVEMVFLKNYNRFVNLDRQHAQITMNEVQNEKPLASVQLAENKVHEHWYRTKR